MRILIAFSILLSISTAAYADDASDAEFARAEEQLKTLRLEGEEREAKIIDDYLQNPTSERAHSTYVIHMTTKKQYAKAQEALERWKKLNPDSPLRAAHEKHLSELIALKGAPEPEEMSKRYLKELFEAGMAEGAAKSGIPKADLAKFSSGDTKELMAAAEELSKNRVTEMEKRFPDLCKKDPAKNAAANLDVTIKLMKIQQKSGTDGLKKEYPNLLKEHPQSEELAESYARFLLDEGKLEEAKAYSIGELKKFPGNADLVLISEELQQLDSLKSIEQREGLAGGIKDKLGSLAIAQAHCVMQHLPK